MSQTMQFVRDLAEELNRQGSRLPINLLAARLNAAGNSTTYGTPYRGGRGTYRLVSRTYFRLSRLGRANEAAMVARAFTRPNGAYAY
jgi:hypothetical protein